ncbi:hypothetical protein IAT40_001935 [Kwoniella sp. CBS 6097]
MQLLVILSVVALAWLSSVQALPSSLANDQLTFTYPSEDDHILEALKGVCPDFDVRCVKDGDWRHPIGKLGPKPFCREGIRCNQCEESKNTRECNRMFRKECEGECEAYGPIPF